MTLKGSLRRRYRAKATGYSPHKRHTAGTRSGTARAHQHPVESLESRIFLSTVTWTSTTGGAWESPGNWSGQAIPQAGDDVIINQPGNLQITLDSSVSVNSVSLTGDTLALQTGATLTTTAGLTNAGTIAVSPNGQIAVGGNYLQTAAGTLSMPGGGLTTYPATNLLAGSDFESPAILSNGTTPPSGWTPFGSATLSNLYAYTGAQSLQTNGPDSGVLQSFAVTPGDSYTLSAYAMTPASDHLTGSEGGFIQVFFFDSMGNPLSANAAPNSTYARGQGSPAGGPLTGSVGDQGWNPIMTAVVAPANAASANAILLAGTFNGTGPGGGSVYWDDPQFGPSVPVPSKLSAVNVTNSGLISVGPTNVVTASGTFTQTSTGTLDVQLGSVASIGDYGSVSSTGPASLGGTLTADFVYGYTPTTDDIFVPITFPRETGNFASESLPAAPGYQFDAAITFTNVVLSAVPTTPLTTTVDATTVIHPVTTNLLGANLAWFDNAQTTTQTQQIAEASGLVTYRFPGFTNTPDFRVDNTSAVTLPQFAQFVQAVGATGLISVPYSTSSPQQDAAEMAYLIGSASDTTPLGIGIEWNAAAGAWQNVNWGTVGYWAALRGASPLATNDGLNFLRIKHAAPFSDITEWEVGNEQYGSWEADYHGGPGPAGVNTGVSHDPATYAAFAAQFAGFASEITHKAALPAVSIGIDTGDPLGRSDNFWTANVLTDGLSLGFVPNFLSDHEYVQEPGGENDQFLLEGTVSNPSNIHDWSTRYAAYQTLLQQTLGSLASGVKVMATEFNSVDSSPGKESTSLVNGLFVADSIGSLLESGYSGGYVYALRNGDLPNDNNSPSLYGWREFGDYGIIGDGHHNLPPNTGAYIPYPSYFAEQLASKLIQPGGEVVSSSSNYQQFESYAVMEANGHLEMLVINDNPTTAFNEQFNIQGFLPSGSAQFWQYGEAQDIAQSKTTTGASALASFSSTLSLSGSNFSYSFPAYSMTVIDLSPATPKVTAAAAAMPNPVTAKTTALSVLGAENGTDAGLIYTWSATSIPAGAKAPLFSDNADNTAKATTATFSSAGNYTLVATITDGAQHTITSSVIVTVKQTLTKLTLAPTSAILSVGATQQFSAKGTDQFGAAMTAAVTWSLDKGSVGTITTAGLYSSGTSVGNTVVRATSGSVSGTAAVSVVASSITGSIFNDANADGVKQSSEPGLAGRSVVLEIAGKGTTGERVTTTNSAGNFSFTNLPAGSYLLIATPPSGWRSTTASAAGDPLTLKAGANITNLVFGQTQLALVTGGVYLDANKDGIHESTESWLAGWIVQLLSTTSSSIKFTTTTNSAGAYSFGAAPAGSYKLVVTPKSGYVATAPAGGAYAIKLTSGQKLANENFGERL